MSFNKGLIHHWDEYYKKDNIPNYPSPFAEYVAKKLSNQQTILEVGCGNGRDATFLASQGHLVTGLDRSGEAIELCKKLYSNESLGFFLGTIIDIAKINKKKIRSDLFSFCYSRNVT